MIWFWLIVVIIILSLITSTAEKTLEKNYEKLGVYFLDYYKYCGGHPNVVQDCKVRLDWYKNGHLNICFKGIGFEINDYVPYDDVKIYSKTEQQIKEDVTLTRLALFGVFAFGMKKEKVNNKYYMVVEYKNSNGEIINLILDNLDQYKFNKSLSILEKHKKANKKESIVIE